MPRKGIRKITVDGVEYKYKISFIKDWYDTGRKVVVEMPNPWNPEKFIYKKETFWNTERITPCMVEKFIRDTLSM